MKLNKSKLKLAEQRAETVTLDYEQDGESVTVHLRHVPLTKRILLQGKHPESDYLGVWVAYSVYDDDKAKEPLFAVEELERLSDERLIFALINAVDNFYADEAEEVAEKKSETTQS